ncbi:flagellar basal body rod protein FlgB [Desulfobacula sp.]|uniref:Flagellar basal body rod protein FlgB n=1 Tax=Candidatus Desulfatibia vada TaxID=2841696 RepID=A0A8J6P483_9BACT|nr:flagellar basal body rod protein FlgB [Candidatus Desulfatibia vada]MBL6996236.1 flagellar basal body rod protein FlgB [Desulfobacula sp.]
MPDKLSFSKTFQALERTIGLSQKRHAVVASNISNIDTPGYRAKDIDFKAALNRVLESGQELDLARTNPGHIDLERSGAAGVKAVEEKGEWNGYNWINIDREMTKLTQNNLIYKTSVETLLRKMAILREVIREGGR